MSGPGVLCAHATIAVARSTIVGQVQAHAIELAEDSLFLGTLFVCRRQHGCIRFSYVGPGSRTPRRFQCQPDLVEAAVLARFERGEITAAERDVLRARERVRVEPEFNSTRYGDPTYGQLTSTCAREITQGAEDQSEMGAFHDLFQPQRAANLRARLAEFAPAGVETAVVFAQPEEATSGSHHEGRLHTQHLSSGQALRPRAPAAGTRAAGCRLERAGRHPPALPADAGGGHHRPARRSGGPLRVHDLVADGLASRC